MTGRWVPRNVRDEVVDFTIRWRKLSDIAVSRFIGCFGISESKYHHWRQRYGQANQHNHHVPRSFWLTEAEREAILAFCRDHPQEGYRRLTYMILTKRSRHYPRSRFGFIYDDESPRLSVLSGWRQPPGFKDYVKFRRFYRYINEVFCTRSILDLG